MAYNQTRDILEQAMAFHQRLGGIYEELQKSIKSENVRVLLDYMSRHEKYLADCLALFEQDLPDNVLDTYFKYSAADSTSSCLADIEIGPDMSINEVIQAAMHFDSCLVQFYKEVVGQAVAPEIRDIFENLLEMEKHEKVELSKKALDIDLV